MELKTTRNDVEYALKSLLIQRARVVRAARKLTTNKGSDYLSHDLHYYFVMARKIYGFIQEAAKNNSKVANLKGNKKYRDLYKKVKIRDHYEHPPRDLDKFPSISPQLKTIRSVAVNKNEIVIHSGDQTWNMSTDHKRFRELIGEFLGAANF